MNTKPALQTTQATQAVQIVNTRLYLAATILLLGAAAYTGSAHPETSDIASGPLTNAASSDVRPNLMFILDDSLSMASDSLTGFESDLLNGIAVKLIGGSGSNQNNTRPSFFSPIGRASNNASSGNGAYYNPAITYLPPVNDTGTLRANSTPTAAPRDGYGILTASTTNLGTKCFSTTTVPLQPTYSIDTVAFVSTSDTECKTTSTSSGGFTVARARFAFYYQYNNTLAVTAGPTANRFECRPPPPAGAAPAGAVYPNVSEGRCYYRVDIIDTPPITNTTPAANSFLVKNPDGTNTTSPATTRTYAQEVQNFANWFSFYRTRINIMKTGAGRAFSDLGDNFRVGFITINPGSPVLASRYLPLAPFTATQRGFWYTKLYAQGTPGSTPLREALSRVGRHYAGITTGINAGMTGDPVEFSCQQNFALLTTDGFWNNAAGVDIAGIAVGNQDNVENTADPKYVTRDTATFDGNVSGASNTLADVAMYYYKTDLRTPTNNPNNATTGIAVNDNNVPKTDIDFANHQHMTTFTLGLGVTGNMIYKADYQTSTTGDFANIRTGASGCSWVSGTCNWPLPVSGALSAVDDLWHAAANGRGVYFNAQDPTALTDGLKTALLNIGVTVGAAAASATSTNNVTPSDNDIYSATYQTGKWDGELTAQKIDPLTGLVSATATWKAQGLLDAKVAASSDTRTIYTFDGSATTKLKPFLFANLTATEQALFTNKCVATFQLSHCGTLTGAALTASNSGTALVNYLRGQTGNEGGAFRDRDHVLGDMVHAAPYFLQEPREEFSEEDYAAFKLKHTTTTPRQGVVYMGSNDGMLHAFNNDNGQELWAYVPKMLLPDLYKLADENYADNHRFYLDSTPETMDICVAPNPPGPATSCTWRTILVSGLGAGGRGFYALDITDPLNPKALWEICSDSTRCAISDAGIGLSYATPVVTKRKFDNKWVALITSGLNNVSPGDGRGYLYVLDALTGAVLQKVTTGVGDTATCTAPTLCGPSGFAHISVHADAVTSDNLGLWVYGGDLWGNVWRFDLSKETPTVLKLAELKDATGKPQSVTTYPEITTVLSRAARIVYFGTGRYLGTRDLPDPATLTPALPYAYQQSLYAIKDTTDTATSGYGNLRALTDMVQQTITTDGAGTSRTVSNNAVDFASKKGWYIDFLPGGVALPDGERMVLNPKLVRGTLTIDTIVPFSNACTAGGDSWQYELSYKSGSYLSNSPGQKAAFKTTGSLVVGSVIVRLPDGKIKRISTSSTGAKTTTGINVEPTDKVIRRMSWREILKQ